MSAPCPVFGFIITIAARDGASHAEANTIVADLMIETRLAPDRIRPVVESLARREPGAARPAILAARLAHFDQDDAAFSAAVDRAESLLAENDWQGRRELASVLLKSALTFQPMSDRTSADEQADLKRAMKWFGEAIKHNNQDVEALWGFGTAATRLGKDLDLAEQALMAARARMPTNAQISVSLANLKGREQKPDEMIPYLRDTIRYTTDLETRRWAADTLKEVRDYVTERDRVAAENLKQREEYEKMRAEYDKKYGKPKKKSGG